MILGPPLRPIDDGAASLDDRSALREDRERARLGPAALRKDLVETRRPADFVITDAMPVERPSRFLAIRGDAERHESYSGFSHVTLP